MTDIDPPLLDESSNAAIEQAATRRRDRFVAWYVASTVFAATFVTAIVVAMEIHFGRGAVNWTVFALIAVLLIGTETQSRTWIRFGDDGVVTASWTFAYALLLLGSAIGAIIAMAVATAAAELIDRKPLIKTIFNVAQISFSLGSGALVLFAFGIHGPAFDGSSTSVSTGIGIIVAGFVVFSANGLVLCLLLAIASESGFVAMMRESFALSMSADAAMLAMAPILVITTTNSLMMLPLMGVATFFVFQTARQAILRAHEADHDPLTQLLNRRAFGNVLDDVLALSRDVAGGVLVLDLDRFKDINDRLGHQVGDLVLQAFGERLVATLPGGAVVSRLGGDEFAVLLDGASIEEVDRTVAALYADLGEPLMVGGFPISAGTSIGVAQYPEDGTSPVELLHAADVAMYRAKRFRSGVERFETIRSAGHRGRLQLLAEIPEALERGEFALHYQAQIDVRTGRTESFEALLRWNHGVHGLIPPGEFISLAEQTDLIGPLTEFVIDRALDDLRRIPEPIRIAVNISARNLQDRRFASGVLDHIARRGVAASRLEVEITENAISADPDMAAVAIAELRAAGVRLAIDDFGTGYSSFGTLRRLEVDAIKIDRSFVVNSVVSDRDATVLRGLIELARGLGLSVVAEGVEATGVLELLGELGCDLAQGFLIAEPAPIEAVMATLERVPGVLIDRLARRDVVRAVEEVVA